jgi:hypothetical protein
MSEQPLPAKGRQNVTALVRAMLDERERKGIETYGRSLETHNGRDAPRDLAEELLDGAQYAIQWGYERQDLLAEIAALRAENIALRSELEREKRQSSHEAIEAGVFTKSKTMEVDYKRVGRLDTTTLVRGLEALGLNALRSRERLSAARKPAIKLDKKLRDFDAGGEP